MRHVPAYNLAFVHIPKNAGLSVRNALQAASPISYAAMAEDLGVTEAEAADTVERSDYQHPALGMIKTSHLPLGIMAEHFPRSLQVIKSAQSFALTREPRERFFSALLQRMKEYGTAGDIRVEDPIVRDEAKRVCDWLVGRTGFTELSHVHFNRQIDYADLQGQRVLTAVFPLTDLDALQSWLASTVGLDLVITRDHARRQPKPWARGVVPAARFVARNLMPRPVRQVLYPLWTGSRVFDSAAETYDKVTLGPEVEGFIAEFYKADAALHAEAVARAGSRKTGG